METDSPLKVSQIVRKIKNLLEGEFRHACVEGEITNISRAASGHWYFTLSDESSSINAALFRGEASRNPLIQKLSNGDQIVCYGSLGVYSKRGTFQIIANKILSAGKGDLQERLEQIKKKLGEEGLFDLENKKKIPSFPRRIGVVTSPQGAALQDFINIYRRRACWMDILLSPALVQGESAPASIREALGNLISYSLKADEGKTLDVIVLTRGGGSLEDLWAFNDEGLAWDVFNCPIPIVSAVGHQINFSVSDQVADLSCETPSAAAEILTQGQYLLQKRIGSLQEGLLRYGKNALSRHFRILEDASPRSYLDILWNQWRYQQQRLERNNPLARTMELMQIHEKKFHLDDLGAKLRYNFESLHQRISHTFKKNSELLFSLNPQKVLTRGYTYVTDENNKIVGSHKEFEKLENNTKIKVSFHDGAGNARKDVL